MNRRHLLVIDDEKAQRDTLAGYLRKRGYSVATAADGQQGLEQASRQLPDLVITDMQMPGMGGQELLETLRRDLPQVEIIIITAFGSVEGAVKAMGAGAFTFLSKPIDLDQLEINIQRALERGTLIQENENLRRELAGRDSFDQVISGSGEMEEVLNLVARVAPSRATVMLLGESGTGKERLARAIHQGSPRSGGAFVPVNMAALPESLMESELFGHERGAFTGASRQRRGLFEEADGGTLFIDEVGDIPLPVQVKLLRVLQESCITRVGGSEPIDIDVRIVAATHQDLQTLIEAGTFREDLYYRLNVVAINIPPLRRRRGDITPLLEHFIAHFARLNGKDVRGIERDALSLVMKYPFPGNVRELENALERAVVLTRGSSIGVDDLPLTIRTGDAVGVKSAADLEEEISGGTLPEQVSALEQRLIKEALEWGGGNQSRAARKLGITEKNIRDRLKRWGWK